MKGRLSNGRYALGHIPWNRKPKILGVIVSVIASLFLSKK